MAKSDKLYGKSPSLKRGEDGEISVHKPTEADGEDMGVEGNAAPGSEGKMPVDVHQMHERHELHHRHVHEKLQMHRRHELEHHNHSGDKSALHKKHEAEHQEMVTRHHEELKAMHKRHVSTAPKAEEKE